MTGVLEFILTQTYDFFAIFVIPFIVLLGTVVIVHEWGHYITARMCGVRVESFSFGFGRELFGYTNKRGTRYKFCLWPLGGYVALFGHYDPAEFKDDPEVEQHSKEERKVAFYSKPLWQRVMIVAAGPVINYIFAIFLFAFLFFTHAEPYIPSIIGELEKGSVLDQAGVQEGDQIIGLNGTAIKRFHEIDLRSLIKDQVIDPVDLKIERQTENGIDVFDVTVQPTVVPREDLFGNTHYSLAKMGILKPELVFHLEEYDGFLAALKAANDEIWRLTFTGLRGLGEVIIGIRDTSQLGGFLRIAALAAMIAEQGLAAFFYFMGILSINIGLINAFPIPALDGGHLMFYFVEWIRGKPLPLVKQNKYTYYGLCFLLLILIFTAINDLVHFGTFEYLAKMIQG